MAIADNVYMDKNDAKRVREMKSTVVEAELQKIVDAGTALTPKGVLESARKKSSPLHKYFEWEDSKAAEKYRLEQAYRLISMTKFLVVLEGAKGKKPTFSPVRKFVSTHHGEPFRMRKDALSETEARAAIVARKLGELRSWCASVVDIDDLAPHRKAILELISQ
jgi:hypothetical protein